MSHANKRKIAFYAPLKSPLHPQPSGDRAIAQLLIKALQQAGYEVRLVSEFRSRDASGDDKRQNRMVEMGKKLAQRLLRRWRTEGYSPDIWFCYHNYYKAPDLIGPIVAERLCIPYWVSEASWADKRAQGRWQTYHRALARGLRQAQGVLVLNPADKAALSKVLNPRATLVSLPAFLDLEALNQQWRAPPQLDQTATRTARLVAVAMLRPGDKLHSFVLLAQALAQLKAPYQLHIVGDGTARLRVQSLFTGMPVRFEGALRGGELRALVGSCDLMVWPAVNEAIGMALLEAQSCGVPVLAGREGGTFSVVNHGVSGELVEARNPSAFAIALQRLLADTERLAGYRAQAYPYVQANHDIDSAAKQIKRALDCPDC